jgi:hypothetical protein
MKASTDIIGEAFKKMHNQQSRRGNGMRELERKKKRATSKSGQDSRVIQRGNDIRLVAKNESACSSEGCGGDYTCMNPNFY